MPAPKSLYDCEYFESREDAERALQRLTNETQPLFLPEHKFLRKMARELTEKARDSEISPSDLLLTYQELRENHSHTDVFCGWVDSTGNKCGGVMYIEVDATGPYYKCKLDQNHFTQKP